jgi:hypothetical protein
MLTILLLLAALAGDPKPAVNVSGNLALNGYDAVAYITDGKPVKGLPQLSTTWSGAVWLNYSKRVQKRWEADIPGYIIKGQANWPDVLKK